MGKLGKKLDDTINSTKTKTASTSKRIAKYTGKRIAKEASEIASYMGSSIEDQLKKGGQKLKDKLEIKQEMTPGQKAGKMMEKFVDLLAVGTNKIRQKIDESQTQKFASYAQMNIPDGVIGEKRNYALTVQKVEKCKAFVQELKKSIRPLKEEKKEVIIDAIQSASTNIEELWRYLKNEKTANTKAEIDYINKEIDILVKKFNLKKEG